MQVNVNALTVGSKQLLFSQYVTLTYQHFPIAENVWIRLKCDY